MILLVRAYLPALLFSNRINEGLNDYPPRIFSTLLMGYLLIAKGRILGNLKGMTIKFEEEYRWL